MKKEYDMQMTNELYKTILAEKLDEAIMKDLTSLGVKDIRETDKELIKYAPSIQHEAALLAMEEVSKFYEWIIRGKYRIWPKDDSGRYYHIDTEEKITESELYQIYKEETKQED